MEIRVLGTGGGFDISNSSILIDNTLLIDIGPYVYPKIKDASISHILLTHAHGDHVMGLWQYAPFRDLHIYGEKPTLERVKSFLESVSDQELLSFHNITWHPLEERGSFHILNYRISYQKARHTGEIDTLIYRINNLVYSTDNVESPEHVPFYQHAEALIRGIGNNPKIHAQLPDVIENAQKAGIKRLYITHYGKQITLPPNPGFEEFRALQENEIIKL